MFLTPKDFEDFLKPLPKQTKVARYPLTNIAEDSFGNLIIEVAIAGFSPEEIEIEQINDELCIIGTKADKVASSLKYYQKNISSENFKRVLVLHESFVDGKIEAKIIDGILTIKVNATKKPEPVKRTIKLS